jgi:hypothetical protein
VDGVQVVAQRRAGPGAPAVVARQLDDAVAQPVQAEPAAEPEVRGGHLVDVELALLRHDHDVERREHDRQRGDARREVLRHTLLTQLVRRAGRAAPRPRATAVA